LAGSKKKKKESPQCRIFVYLNYAGAGILVNLFFYVVDNVINTIKNMKTVFKRTLSFASSRMANFKSGEL